jgi:YhcH/YjgK/YiaL family protein
MIIDFLDRAGRYGPEFRNAFSWLLTTDLDALPAGRHPINGDHLFALVNEYDTVDPSGEKLEAHRAHIDLQYLHRGVELIGHAFLRGQRPSQAYDPETDFMLFDEPPSFFSKLDKGMFAIFYPEDLHMPNLRAGQTTRVKKIIIKVKI